MPEFDVVTLKSEPFAYLALTAPMSGIAATLGQGFERLSQAFETAKATMVGMPMCHYLTYDEQSTSFQLGFPALADQCDALRAAGLLIGETPSGRNMTAIHMGAYDTLVDTYNAMTEAMQAQGLKGTPDMWEIYYSPPDVPPEQIKTEVIWPLQ